MGMDIHSHKCFFIELSKFVGLLRPQHLRGIQEDAIRLCRRRMSNWAVEWADDDTPEMLAKMNDIHQRIASANTIDEVIDILAAIVNARVPDHNTYVSDACILDSDPTGGNCDSTDGIAEMTFLQCVSRVILPLEPVRVRVFESSRTNGGDVPIGKPVLEFNYDDCFETRMTARGQALAQALGKEEILPDVWTEMSI